MLSNPGKAKPLLTAQLVWDSSFCPRITEPGFSKCQKRIFSVSQGDNDLGNISFDVN